MTVYGSDYNERTREQIKDRGQRSREVAVTAATRILAATLSPQTDTTTDEVAANIIDVAKKLETYIRRG